MNNFLSFTLLLQIEESTLLLSPRRKSGGQRFVQTALMILVVAGAVLGIFLLFRGTPATDEVPNKKPAAQSNVDHAQCILNDACR